MGAHFGIMSQKLDQINLSLWAVSLVTLRSKDLQTFSGLAKTNHQIFLNTYRCPGSLFSVIKNKVTSINGSSDVSRFEILHSLHYSIT